MGIRASAATDVGRVRDHNEDSHVVDAELGLHVVADGMGGHAFGEVASQLATRHVREYVAERRDRLEAFVAAGDDADPAPVRAVLGGALRAAAGAVWIEAQRDPERRGMGTTCSAVLVAGSRAFVAHVGDSRVYLVRDGRALQLTQDHTLLAQMLEDGQFPGAARAAACGFAGALVRAVGVCPDVEVDVFDVETVCGDAFLLCSDGLTRHVTDAELGSVVAHDPEAAPARLIAIANDRGGLDNVTVICVSAGAAAASDGRRHELSSKTEAFRRIPLFRHLDDAQLFRVLAATQARSFEAGDVVITEGEPGDAMYVVLSGAVRVEKSGDVVARLGRGTHFGELALLDGAPRSATVVMDTDGRLLRLRREALEDLMSRTPEVAINVLRSFAATLSERLRTTTDALHAARAVSGASR